MAHRKSSDEWVQVFKYYDKNGNGTLGFGELETLLTENDSSMDKSQIEVAFTLFDGDNGDKQITLDEFAKGMQRLNDRTALLIDAFKAADKDQTGALSKEESKAIVHKFYPDMTGEQADAIFVMADKDGDGKISLEEFLEVCAK